MQLKKVSIFLAVVSALALCSPALADNFPAKPIAWIVPYGPGGGYDTYARAIGSSAQKYFPKETSVIVKNVTGAGGRTGTNFLYRGKPDGYHIGFVPAPGLVIAPLFMKTNYDLEKFCWLGQIAVAPYCIFVKKDSPLNTVEDLKKHKNLRFANTQKGSGFWFFSLMAQKVLDLKDPKFVSGYRGTAECIPALLRGDVEVFLAPVASVWSYLNRGEIKAVLALSAERLQDVPDVPSAGELGYSDLRLCSEIYLLAAPPGTPEARAKIIENAIMKAMKDERSINWAKKLHKPLGPVISAKDVDAKVKEMIRTYGKFQKYIK